MDEEDVRVPVQLARDGLERRGAAKLVIPAIVPDIERACRVVVPGGVRARDARANDGRLADAPKRGFDLARGGVAGALRDDLRGNDVQHANVDVRRKLREGLQKALEPLVASKAVVRPFRRVRRRNQQDLHGKRVVIVTNGLRFAPRAGTRPGRRIRAALHR